MSRTTPASLAALSVAAVLGIACADRSTSVDTPLGADVPTLRERYVTARDPAMNIDSVATHSGTGGVTWLFATAKEGDVIRVFDASSGELLRDVGGPGTAAGQFERPNGVVAIDGLLVIVERDNRRVQILNVPQFESIAVFGSEQLVNPYGAYVQGVGEDRYRLFVTDNYETADEQVPPDAELGRRVHVWNLEVARSANGTASSVVSTHDGAFGETSGPGVLRVVESLWGDPDLDRLMIAEEDEDPVRGRVIKAYTLDGRFSGETIGAGIFKAQAEGIALYECRGGEGYWVTTDQSETRNVFHVFDRRTLAHIGSFQGATTLNTDGIWLTREPLRSFPAGAFFAVHDDQAVAAFDWRDIAAALNLGNCPT